jgi:long-chain fatty acid transport protein
MKRRIAIMSRCVGLASLCLGWVLSCEAAGFQLFEGNASNSANFSAGMGAGLFDASTASYNPAALADIDATQVVASFTFVETAPYYQGSASWASTVAPEVKYSESGRSFGGGINVLPALHLAYPINSHSTLALSITAPFGLATEYASTLHPWFFRVAEAGEFSYIIRQDVHPVTRYAATLTDLKTIDVSPAWSYACSDYFSVGAGLNLQYAAVTFNAMAGAPLVAESNLDTESANHGDSYSLGYHFGLLVKPHPDLRLGLSYISRVSHHFHGRSAFLGGIAAAINLADSGINDPRIVSHDLRANTVLPDTIIAGLFYRIDPEYDLLATAVWTHWHLLKHITLRGVTAGTLDPTPHLLPPLSISMPQHFRNTLRVSIGLNYHIQPHLTLRAGLGFDQTPSTDATRTVRLPDGNRVAIAAGLRYQTSRYTSVNFGWTHLFIQTVPIRNCQHTASQIVCLDGQVRNHANLFAMQLQVLIDE